MTPPGPAEPFSATQDLFGWLTAQFRCYGGIFKANIDGFDTYVLSEPDYAQHVLRTNWQNYPKGWANRRVTFLLGNGLMASEGELWQAQRRMVQPLFHRAIISPLYAAIIAANAGLLERWKSAAKRREHVNVTRDVSRVTLEVVLTALFGDDYPALAPKFRLLSAETRRDLRFAQEFRALRTTVAELVAVRRNAGIKARDLLGLLMAARSKESHVQMSDAQLVSEVMTLVVAGHETTASVLNWAWYLLARHPCNDERLAAEIPAALPECDGLPNFGYVRQVLEEVMRLYPPGWLMTRKALANDCIAGFVIPAGSEIYISPYIIQRHPAHWPDPDQFDPDRFAPNRGEGRHPLAMLP
ncbi:MAG TPA: cytochrome P450, partial [Stellaceae bacterium]|nr:cytochrome P450 [Stellaceae bacterium]